MNTFFLIWQDPDDRRWYPVGRLDRVGEWYLFAYTRGAKMSPRFVPFGNLSDTGTIYLSTRLFPIFANRVLSEKRPEYSKYASWSGFRTEGSDPLTVMAIMGGERATDTLQVYPMPQRDNESQYRSVFFAHGLSHLMNDSHTRSLGLSRGERLFPMLDIQNPYDGNAVAIRTSDPSCLVGYLPRHLAPDFRKLSNQFGVAPTVTVFQVNQDAPPQFRVLCEAVAPWPAGFQPCSGEEYRTIPNYDAWDVVQDHMLHEQAVSGER